MIDFDEEDKKEREEAFGPSTQDRIRGPKNELSTLFEDILDQEEVGPIKWAELMNKYLQNPRNRIPRDSRKQSSARGNLNKELSKGNMTWRNFVKGIRFLNPIKATFTVKLTWAGGRTTVHERTLVNRQKRNPPNKPES